MPDRRILVVGTTPDYIAYIHKRYPHRALFLTDTSIRAGASDPAPDEPSEIVTDLGNDPNNVLANLQAHLKTHNQILTGVTCYDCEWLTLAAELARSYGLSYSSPEAVKTARSKFLSKKRWLEGEVRCPASELIDTGRQALEFQKKHGQIVLKPLTGSGSELTFLCRDALDSSTAFEAIKSGLIKRRRLPLYKECYTTNAKPTATPPMLAEEYVGGREYSADFIVDGDQVTVIRVAKKLQQSGQPFGTTMAYVLPATLPEHVHREFFEESLCKASHALGLTHAICMVDFKICRDEIVFLELTPRIGGDCLPMLIRQSCGLDTIGLALEFAEGNAISIPPQAQWTELIGLRLFATRSGTLTGIDIQRLANHPQVKETFVKRRPGHKIVMPPDDYDSWILGHVIFEPQPNDRLPEQCESITDKVTVSVESYHDQEFSRISNKSRRTA